MTRSALFGLRPTWRRLPPRRPFPHWGAFCARWTGNRESVSLIRWASEFSKAEGATLRLVHVVPGMGGVPSGQMDSERGTQIRKEARDALDRLEASAGVRLVPICVAGGNVAETICQEARRHDADLVVIGRGVLHETLGRLRTHAHAIIRQSPCPVLSV